MKTIKAICVVLLCITAVSSSKGDSQQQQSQKLDKNQPKEPNQKSTKQVEENYFRTWLELREMRRFDKIQDLLNKLTEEELVLAVRQTYEGLIERKLQHAGENDYDSAYLAVRDFTNKYFDANSDRSPEPFLKMLEDTSDNLFRRMLIESFDRAYDKERPSFQIVFDSLITLISDANEPLELRQTADSTISRLLGHQYYNIRMSKDDLNRLSVKELLSFPKEKLSPETKKRIKILADDYNRYNWAVLSLTQRNLTLYERLYYGAVLSDQKKHGFVTDPPLIKVLDDTVNKLELNKDELIEGVKKVNEKITERKNKHEKLSRDVGWEGEAIYTAGGFIQSYFRRFPDENPKPFLKIAADKNNDEDFRNAMLDILGHNSFYNLQKADLDTFSNILLEIASDDKNSPSIKKESVECLLRQLGRLETANKNDTQLLRKINVIRDKATQKPR